MPSGGKFFEIYVTFCDNHHIYMLERVNVAVQRDFEASVKVSKYLIGSLM